jgi:hypothetical protein
MTFRVPLIGSWLVAVCVTALVAACPVEAQIIGNPVRTLRPNEWSAGLSSELMDVSLGSGSDKGDFRSYRGLSKIAFGVSEQLTVSLVLGLANLEIDNPGGGSEAEFKGGFRLAHGYQALLDIADYGDWTLFSGAGLVSIRSNGEYDQIILDTVNSYSAKMQWTEYSLVQGLRYNHPKWTMYGGIEELDIRHKEKITGDNYKSGFQVHYFAGCDINMSRTFCFNIQVKSGRATTVSVGLSERTMGF